VPVLGREVELSQDAANVRFDGLLGHEECSCDAAVGQAFRNECEHCARYT